MPKRGSQPLLSSFESIRAAPLLRLTQFSFSHLTGLADFPIMSGKKGKMRGEFADASWLIDYHLQAPADYPDAAHLVSSATVIDGAPSSVCFELRIDFAEWTESNYVLLPGAAYGGNRFRAWINESGHTPLAKIPNASPTMEPLITNIARLNRDSGPSMIQYLSGDMATPCAGIHFPRKNLAMLVVTEQGTVAGDFSFRIEESEDRRSASLIVRVPGVREDGVWRPGPLTPERADRAANLLLGDSLHLHADIHLFRASRLQDLFDRFFAIRKEHAGPRELRHDLPFSAAWRIQEKKYNLENWVESEGYYSVGMRENPYQDWQTGWTGGINAAYPLLLEGGPLTRQRVLRSFDFLCERGVAPCGLFWDVYHQGQWYHHRDHERAHNPLIFLRRNSDALFFMIKSFLLLRQRKQPIRQAWIDSVRRCLDVYVSLWERYGQFGQWIDGFTGEIVLGRTAGNAIACAALARASEFFAHPRYLTIAEEAARRFYASHVETGLLNGGPGDILQAVDSESAFGMLESYLTLYELTADWEWIRYAEETAAQCATWVVSYDFRFPALSTFARLKMLTTGTVIANVQNKHSAPGICTLSGDSLFRLFRTTGDARYLELIADIAHAIPQYLSRKDRPIPDTRPGQRWPVMAPGWMNERINMSDWEERGNPGDIRRGEIFGGSCWCEVSSMLTWAEIPGIYVQPDTGFVQAIDHVDVAVKKRNTRGITLRITNPTNFPASVKVFAENSSEMKNPLKPGFLACCRKMSVPAGGSVMSRFDVSD